MFHGLFPNVKIPLNLYTKDNKGGPNERTNECRLRLLEISTKLLILAPNVNMCLIPKKLSIVD